MLTRINPKKTYFNSADAQKDILDAMSGDWGNEHQKVSALFILEAYLYFPEFSEPM